MGRRKNPKKNAAPNAGNTPPPYVRPLGEYIKKHAPIQEGSLVLDLGCGNFPVSLQAAEDTDCTIVGLDRSIDHVARSARQDARLALVKMDLEEAFDGGISLDPNQATNETTQQHLMALQEKLGGQNPDDVKIDTMVIAGTGIHVFDDIIRDMAKKVRENGTIILSGDWLLADRKTQGMLRYIQMLKRIKGVKLQRNEICGLLTSEDQLAEYSGPRGKLTLLTNRLIGGRNFRKGVDRIESGFIHTLCFEDKPMGTLSVDAARSASLSTNFRGVKSSGTTTDYYMTDGDRALVGYQEVAILKKEETKGLLGRMFGR